MKSVIKPRLSYDAMTKLARLLFFAQRFWNNNHLTASTTALSTSSTHQKVSEVASYISEHYDTASSLDTVAQHFYISKSYLSRIFKEFTGYTVNEYINLNRIQQAQNLLIKSNMNITEIASTLAMKVSPTLRKSFGNIPKPPLLNTANVFSKRVNVQSHTPANKST